MSRSRGGRRQAGCSSSPGSFSSRSGHAHEHIQALGKIMDLGIRGKTALVCAASKGLGKGGAASLAAEGVNLVIPARGREALEATAAELRERFGIEVTAVPGDISTEEGRQAALRACASPDILVNNAGGPPPGDFRDWDRETRSEEHTSELQSRLHLVCRLLLEKKKKQTKAHRARDAR